MQVTQAIVTALVIQTVAGDVRPVVFQELPLTNVTFSDYLLFESHVSTKLQCPRLCLNRAECVTFTYTKTSSSSGVCRGYSNLHQNSDPQMIMANTQYYGKECTVRKNIARNCKDMRTMQPGSGVRQLCFNSTSLPVYAYCDQDTDGGNWTVIQRRQDGSVNFNVTWAQYQAGFGDPAGEHWLGLETIYKMTSTQSYEIRFDLQLYDNTTGFDVYRDFSVGPSSDFYRLYVGSRTAGNLSYYNYFSNNNGNQFSTWDSDNDVISSNCAASHGGGWWYQSCSNIFLNSPYSYNSSCSRYSHCFICPIWDGFGPPCFNALQKTSMKIRPMSP